MTSADRATADRLSDLLHAAIDDTGARMSPLLQRRVIARMAELAELAGYSIVRGGGTSTATSLPNDSPWRRR